MLEDMRLRHERSGASGNDIYNTNLDCKLNDVAAHAGHDDEGEASPGAKVCEGGSAPSSGGPRGIHPSKTDSEVEASWSINRR